MDIKDFKKDLYELLKKYEVVQECEVERKYYIIEAVNDRDRREVVERIKDDFYFTGDDGDIPLIEMEKYWNIIEEVNMYPDKAMT